MTAPIRLYLIDGSGYIFRAYHALPPLTRKRDGAPVGAVAGYCNMLYKLLADMADEHDPTHLAVIFDYSAKTFRNQIYPEYKAHRPEPPEDLRPQFSMVRDATRAFNVACIEMDGYEADDIIASYARHVESQGGDVVIVSSDKDLMQLVSDRVSLFDTMKNRKIGRAEVVEKFGVGPERVVDVQALAGDSVDNVPGVPGIGVKTAAQLIEEYGDLDTLLARAGEIKQEKRRQNLVEHAEAARVSRALVTLKSDIPLPEPLDALAMPAIDVPRLSAYLADMEFMTLHKRLAGDFPDGVRRGGGARPAAAAPNEAPAAAPSARRDPLEAAPYGPYAAVGDEGALAAFVAAAYERGFLAVQAYADGHDPMREPLVGLSLAVAPGRAVYVPLAAEEGLALDGAPRLAQSRALAVLRPALEDPSLLKVAHDWKFTAQMLSGRGVAARVFDDVMLMSYALDCGRRAHDLVTLAQDHLGVTATKRDDATGAGRARAPLSASPLEAATRYAAGEADIALRLHAALKPRLAAEGRTALYESTERPLAPVLAAMERAGVRIDPAVLAGLSSEFAQRMAAREAEAHALAGGEFKLGSAAQVSDVLFGKLGLPGGRKTPGGQWSTRADILEELAAEGHPLPRAILDWRQASKLKNTYTDALPAAVNPSTGRVHTSYALAATTTGRLSSTEPNLQNIPIRTDDGRKIRRAFVAERGRVLVSADYSQIELRLLAHIADLPSMKKAFADGVDIHALTASEMFGVPVAGMDPAIRRRAKAINFGIIYGISAFGLANQLGIERGEAKAYIDSYFLKFPGIRRYMEETVAAARRNGYVETIFGRRIYVGGVNDKNPALKGYAERQAINAPIQGAAADVIRRAMVRMPAALEKARLASRMLLQVHDELVFEAPAEEAETLKAVVVEVMTKAPAPRVALTAPLVVEAKAGRNWDEAH